MCHMMQMTYVCLAAAAATFPESCHKEKKEASVSPPSAGASCFQQLQKMKKASRWSGARISGFANVHTHPAPPRGLWQLSPSLFPLPLWICCFLFLCRADKRAQIAPTFTKRRRFFMFPTGLLAGLANHTAACCQGYRGISVGAAAAGSGERSRAVPHQHGVRRAH